MLELHRAEGAFEALEHYLDSEGFWGRDHVVADLYLGYGLSEPMRRTAAPAPPEPCGLPLLVCRIRAATPGRAAQVTTRHLPRFGEWERSWDDEAYAAAIDAVRAAIARGDVYQTNLV